jgi:hypothetical protein
MATGTRTLKLSILGDTESLQKSLKSATNDTETFGSKMSDIGKKIGVAFALAAAAAAAYAVKIGIDGVKSAIEDEAAQLRLASALKSATGATDSQIKATEDYISKMQLATGVSDTDLRASMQRLAVSTKDVSKSQDILNLAIDVSKGTGKDLATVTEALAKSYEGNDAKLAKLGIGLTATDLKTKDFKQTTQALADLYGGAAATAAETFQGRLDRLKQGFEEGKEAIGTALLPVLEKMIGFIFQYGVPIFNKFKDAWDVIANAIDKNKEKFSEFIELMQVYVLPVLQTVFGFLIDVGAKVASAIISAFGTILGAITPIVNFIIDSINLVIRGLNLIKPGSDIAYLNKIGGSGSTSASQDYRAGERGSIASSASSASTPMTPSITLPSGGGTTSKVPVSAGLDYSKLILVPGTDRLDLNAPQNAASARLQAQADAYFKANPNIDPMTGAKINITVNGAIDSEGTARTIVDVLNDSYWRGTIGASKLQGIN